MTPATRGERIVRFQDLYEKYSQLAFTNSFDRPIAIDGLQNRLIEAFENDTKGGFGVFHDGKKGGLLHRSLLWHRSPREESLKAITFPLERRSVVPSWSWMAYTGAIKYLLPHFGEVEWEEVESPWSREPALQSSLMTDRTTSFSLKGKVRKMIMPPLVGAAGNKVIWDVPGGSEKMAHPKCLVLAVRNESFPRESLDARMHWVIILKQHERKGGEKGSLYAYRRIGAAELPGRYIARDGEYGMIH
jgi:hypothetical protein